MEAKKKLKKSTKTSAYFTNTNLRHKTETHTREQQWDVSYL